MNYLVLIGDIIASRRLVDRAHVQEQLREVVSRLNAMPAGLVSPYTITLGDEFQAVFATAERMFPDALAIAHALYPVQVRFALGIGEITTAINSQQAIGMDGPAFHAARAGMQALKKEGTLFSLRGLRTTDEPLVQHTLDLLSFEMMKGWDARHYQVCLRLYERGLAEGKSRYGMMVVPQLAQELQMTERGVFRLIKSGALRQAIRIFHDIACAVDHEVDA